MRSRESGVLFRLWDANEDAENSEVKGRENWGILPGKRGTVYLYLLTSSPLFQYLGVHNREKFRLHRPSGFSSYQKPFSFCVLLLLSLL